MGCLNKIAVVVLQIVDDIKVQDIHCVDVIGRPLLDELAVSLGLHTGTILLDTRMRC